MGRALRTEGAGDVVHVYARANRKADIFFDDVDRHTYVSRLARVIEVQQWSCLGYCLMPNHVHLLLELEDTNLSEGMHLLHSHYARIFNARHGQVGHLFQGRYGSVRVTDDEQLATTVGYIATNPVKAGLVQEPEAWSWGSHAALVRGQAPRWLATRRLEQLLSGAFGGDGGDRYRELVAERLRAPAPEPEPSLSPA